MLVRYCKNCDTKEPVEDDGDLEHSLPITSTCGDCGDIAKVVPEEDAHPCGECDGEGETPCWNYGGSGIEDTGGDEDEEEQEDCIECVGFGMIPCGECS